MEIDLFLRGLEKAMLFKRGTLLVNKTVLPLRIPAIKKYTLEVWSLEDGSKNCISSINKNFKIINEEDRISADREMIETMIENVLKYYINNEII